MLRLLRIVVLYGIFFVACLLIAVAYVPTTNPALQMAITFLAPAALVGVLERRKGIKLRNEKVARAIEQYDADFLEDRIKLNRAVEAHASAVARNFRKSVTVNDYGAITRDDRDAAARELLESVGVSLSVMTAGEAAVHIQNILDSIKQEATREGFDPSFLPTNGIDFEEWVAEGLRKFGWDAYATQASGDQGVDVIAKKDDVSIAIQCKLYSQAVGNKAVQEALAGAAHMGISKAAVLTNAEFTRSAKELAASTGVLLLSPEDIPSLHVRF